MLPCAPCWKQWQPSGTVQTWTWTWPILMHTVCCMIKKSPTHTCSNIHNMLNVSHPSRLASWQHRWKPGLNHTPGLNEDKLFGRQPGLLIHTRPGNTTQHNAAPNQHPLQGILNLLQSFCFLYNKSVITTEKGLMRRRGNVPDAATPLKS